MTFVAKTKACACNLQRVKEKIRKTKRVPREELLRVVRDIGRSTGKGKGTDPFDLQDLIHHPRISPRAKRGATLIVMAFLGLLGGSLINFGRHQALSEKVNVLAKQMTEFRGQLQTIHESVSVLRQGLVNLTRITVEGFEHMYEIIETSRCAMLQGIENTQIVLTAEIYRNYLYAHLEAIMEMSRSGKISPLLIGVDRLQGIIDQNEDLRTSLIGKENSLFYQHARGYPVKLDFHGFRFGFILEIPLPTKKEVHVSYKIFNVGFHASEILDRGYGRRVYVHKAPLPQRAIAKEDSTLIPLDDTQCITAGGVGLCNSGALSSGKPSPCLMLLTDPHCNKHCENTDDCIQQIEVFSMPPEAEVAMTSAGTLIRAPLWDCY